MYKLIFISLALMLFSCSSIKKHQNDSDYLMVNEMELNDDFLSLILERKREFEGKFKFQPNLIIIRLANDIDNYISISFSTKSNLYDNVEEKEFINEEFISGINIDGTFVLLNKTNIADLSPFLRIKRKVVKYNINYGNTFYLCDNFYTYKDELFILKDRYCSGSIYTK
ncbi:MAG: hypothetical protein ABNG98_02070 [Flavobacterium sp.]